MKEIIIIAILIALIALYIYYENNILKVTKYSIKSKKYNCNKTLKVLHLSDYHNSKSDILNRVIISKVNEIKPDIIVFTGDIVDSSRTNIETALKLIDNMKDNKIYYVPGNHEARIKDYQHLLEELRKRNVTILDNKNAVYNGMNIYGIKDPFFKSQDKLLQSNIIKEELNAFDIDTNEFNILLSHRPEMIDEYSSKGYDLVFTGHAHGGQWRVPFIGGLYTPHQGFFPKYTSGVHKKSNTNMVISRGLGNSSFPIRLNNRPEMVIMEVRNETNN